MRKQKRQIFCLPDLRDNPLDYIAASDVYLSTSRWEGLPYSLIEASMMGLPIVATNVVGNNEVVQNGFNGKLFDSGDLKTAVNDILEICLNKNLSESYGVNAKKFYKSNFSVDKMITQMHQIYASFIEN